MPDECLLPVDPGQLSLLTHLNAHSGAAASYRATLQLHCELAGLRPGSWLGRSCATAEARDYVTDRIPSVAKEGTSEECQAENL